MADSKTWEWGTTLTGYNTQGVLIDCFHTWHDYSSSDLPSNEGVGMRVTQHENEAPL